MYTPNIDYMLERILPTTTPLTNYEFNILHKSIDESNEIINRCGPNDDDDVLAWHEHYLERVIKRVELSLKLKRMQKCS